MGSGVLIHRFNTKDYHSLIDAGVLHEDDRVELIDGRIVDMTPVGTRHSACVNRLNTIFAQKLKGQLIVSIQNPIQLGEQSEPEPDFVLLKYREDFYSDELPEAEDVLLLIEVADTSLDYDRNTKIPLYAKAGISEVWLADLLENCIEIYMSPSAEGYGNKRLIRNEQSVSPQNFPDINLTANQILGIKRS